MSDEDISIINEYLVDIFNEVLIIEEQSLKQSQFKDLTIREMHTIEAIGLSGRRTVSEVAESLVVTKGTLSVSVRNLERKGYVRRVRQEDDRRVVHLQLTAKGKLLYRIHNKFHRQMVEQTIKDLENGQAQVLIKGLKNLYCYLNGVKENLKG